MNEERPLKTLLVAAGVCLVCSLIVSTTVSTLRPIQLAYRSLDRYRVILAVAGLMEQGEVLADREIALRFQRLEPRIVELATAALSDAVDPLTFDAEQAAADPALGVEIATDDDLAQLGRRARYAPIYLLREDGRITRVVLPVCGEGMWSTIRGYLALDGDLDTIAAVRFHEHGETPGIGDVIQSPSWLARWQGKRVRDETGKIRFEVTAVTIDPSHAEARYQVDGMTGATVTGDAVTNLVRYWLGDDAFGPILERLRAERDGAPVEKEQP